MSSKGGRFKSCLLLTVPVCVDSELIITDVKIKEVCSRLICSQSQTVPYQDI